MGSLQFLDKLYTDLLIPSEVIDELKAAGDDCAELNAIRTCRALRITETPVRLPILLASQLDKGEASVIQNALNFKVSTVVIDEKA
ncbi:hypothetical protein RZS08_18600, partial [Arthrospira platensis SPKY1]|nr:hypothetical protein [Arthrospira platensis SPKY1]